MNTFGRRIALAAVAAAFGIGASALANPPQHHGGGDRGGGGERGGGGAHYAAPAGRGYSYPSRGAVVGALPRGGIAVNHLDHRYWYHGGTWYAPRGPRWLVVAPPFGAYVPFLPGFYSTYWWGGVPYFYANDAYYVWREPSRAYEVVEPPEGAPAAAPAADEDIYLYPRNGQTQEQQSQDRYECHRWAAGQTHFDPTRVGGGVDGDAPVRRAEYFRAIGACLEGRGYSVK